MRGENEQKAFRVVFSSFFSRRVIDQRMNRSIIESRSCSWKILSALCAPSSEPEPREMNFLSPAGASGQTCRKNNQIDRNWWKIQLRVRDNLRAKGSRGAIPSGEITIGKAIILIGIKNWWPNGNYFSGKIIKTRPTHINRRRGPRCDIAQHEGKIEFSVARAPTSESDSSHFSPPK